MHMYKAVLAMEDMSTGTVELTEQQYNDIADSQVVVALGRSFTVGGISGGEVNLEEAKVYKLDK